MIKHTIKNKEIMVYTIGHSTHPLQEFIELLQEYGIKNLVDIRTIAKSRHNPQFNEDTLKEALKKVHIHYYHMKHLGGLRHALKDSVNTAWRNASFRGYADYMQTKDFQQGIQELIEKAEKEPTVIMCAEAVPWRCHRSLVADALLVRGIMVKDIMSKTSLKDHELTPWAKVKGTTITYPGKTKAK